MPTSTPEFESSQRTFHPYWPAAKPGLHWHRHLPVLCGLGLQLLGEIDDVIVDRLSQQVSLPGKPLKLYSPNIVESKLASLLRVKCLDEDVQAAMDRVERPEYGSLTQTAAASTLRSCLPEVAGLSQQIAPLAHTAKVRTAISYILDLMLKAGEIHSLSHSTAA